MNTAGKLSILVNDRQVTVHRGMRVKHAIIAYGDQEYRAAVNGDLVVIDEHGFRVGLDGALHDGARLYLRTGSN